jgi:hypothetical protein
MRTQCEATTINGQTIAAPYLFRDVRGGNFQLIAVFTCTDRDYTADFFNQTGEHDDKV